MRVVLYFHFFLDGVHLTPLLHLTALLSHTPPILEFNLIVDKKDLKQTDKLQFQS